MNVSKEEFYNRLISQKAREFWKVLKADETITVLSVMSEIDASTNGQAGVVRGFLERMVKIRKASKRGKHPTFYTKLGRHGDL
jgi:hypothetical protein